MPEISTSASRSVPTHLPISRALRSKARSGAAVGERAQGAQRAAQAPQPDPQLVRAVRIVGLEHGLAVDEDLAHRGFQDDGEGLGARVLAADADGPRLLGLRARPVFLQRQPVAALGLAARAELELVAREQLLGCQQRTFGVACLQFEFRLAHLARFIARADLAVIDGQLDLTALRLDRARRALDDGLKHRRRIVPFAAFFTVRLIFLSAIFARSGSSRSTGASSSIGLETPPSTC